MSKILDTIKDKFDTTAIPIRTLKSGLGYLSLSVPKCKIIAKELAKSNYKEIFSEENTFYEEKFIKALMIGYLKLPFKEVIEILKEYVKEFDNWGIVDCTVGTLKIFKKNLDEGLDFIDYCFNLNMTYSIRFAYVLLLSYYLDQKYLDYIFTKIRNEKSNEYHVKMAVAWLISYLYVKFPGETLKLFDGTLDKFTNNKAISKIRESFRVSDNDKEMIKQYRI